MSKKNRRKNKHQKEPDTVEHAAAEDQEIRDDDEERESVEAASDAPPEEDGGVDAVEEKRDPAEEERERLAAEAQEMRLLAQRKQAEFENYRKRVERERAETFKYAEFEVLKVMLPVLDNLERAVEAAQSDQAGSTSQLREGVEIVTKQFRDTLEKLGLSEVKAQNEPFDPHIHEAVSRVESDEYPEGTVVDVLQKGYLFKDRLLRPAMVSVSLPGNGDSSESRDDRENEDEPVHYRE